MTMDALGYGYDLIKDSSNIEIALHGLNHEPLINMDLCKRENLLAKSLNFFNKMGCVPYGFRATKLAIDTQMIRLLSKFGMLYDSSVLPRYVPFKTYIGWRGNAPLIPYNPNENNYKIYGDLRIIELPISTARLINMPLYGTWLRYFGEIILKLLPLDTCYIHICSHSWDFTPVTKLGYRTGKSYAKILTQVIKKLLNEQYEFKTCIDIVKCASLIDRKVAIGYG
jgi:hypothetical protein